MYYGKPIRVTPENADKPPYKGWVKYGVKDVESREVVDPDGTHRLEQTTGHPYDVWGPAYRHGCYV